MENEKKLSRLYLANVVEENVRGFHRETLWYGGDPKNLGALMIDVMKDWYEPNIEVLDKSITEYHKMLEDKDDLTFKKLEGVGFDADGMRMRTEITNDMNVIFSFVVREICDIYGKEGETPESFASFEDFKKRFTEEPELDEAFSELFKGINEITLSRALVTIDIKYNYTARHFNAGNA